MCSLVAFEIHDRLHRVYLLVYYRFLNIKSSKPSFPISNSVDSVSLSLMLEEGKGGSLWDHMRGSERDGKEGTLVMHNEEVNVIC